ncbi:MAG: biotin-dependent carboxyltransferase family protein [Rhodocyclaceae bacterium]
MNTSLPAQACATLEVRSPGAYASIQDSGRFGLRRFGVPWSGTLDPALMRIANRLAGNDEDAAVIEAFDGGQQLAAEGAPLRIAVAGNAELEIVADGERRPAAPWRSHLLKPGETLKILRTRGGRLAMVAIAGLDLPTALGSRATYARAALGGTQGRALAPGDRLAAGAASAGPERVLASPPEWPADARTPIRVVLGPQADYFDRDATARFLGQVYTVGTAADRMGIRLDGAEALTHRSDMGNEIVSDATVPGSIQVPGTGQPIVLLADAQTAGGYPKIATVIGIDRPRLAARRPGESVRFAAVGVAEAEALARAHAAEVARLCGGIRLIAGEGVDLQALYGSNLVGGVVNALQPDHIP